MLRTRCAGGLGIRTVVIVGATMASLLGLGAGRSQAQCDLEEAAKLVAGDPQAGDQFGKCVAMDGDTIAVSAPYDDDLGPEVGSVYVFVRIGDLWVQQAKLIPPGSGSGALFGHPVDIDGDTLVVGDPMYLFNHEFIGAAYVYVRSAGVWTLEATLHSPCPQNQDVFGGSVSVDGDSVLVGAPQHDGPCPQSSCYRSGSAYVFVRVAGTWALQAWLTASNASLGDLFGAGVAVSGDTALVIATFKDLPGYSDAGSVYVFRRIGGLWTEEAELAHPIGSSYGSLWRAVGCSGDTAVVGAEFDLITEEQSARGAAYVFHRDQGLWSLQAALTASGEAYGPYDENFGYSVALHEDRIVVGAHYAPGFLNPAGAAYVFTRSAQGDWTQLTELVASDAEQNQLFGFSVGIWGDTVLVGAPSDDRPNLSNAGAAYVFDLRGHCRGDLNCDGWIDFDDINPFVLYLANFAAWQTAFADCPPQNGDINDDCTYPSFGDINPFVALLSSQPLPITCP